MTRFKIFCLAISIVGFTCGSMAEAQTSRASASSSRGITSLRDRMQSRMNSGGSSRASALADDEDSVGAISGNERFLREARDATDFVGAGAREGFVGGQSAVGQAEIRSAIEGDLVREADDPAINRQRSLPQLQTGMYAPRLRLGFTAATLPLPTLQQAVAERLSASATIHATRPIEVSMAGRTATLRGAVGSEHEKRLAALMLLFEPGISRVENELSVAPPAADSPMPQPLPAAAPVPPAGPLPEEKSMPDRS